MFQVVAQLQKEIDTLSLEKQNVEKKFEDSTKETKGNRSQNCYSSYNL